MDNYVLGLIKSENNNFSEHDDEAFLFFSINNNGGTGKIEIRYDIAEEMEINSIYQDERFNLYHIMGKQHDANRNLILLCREVK